jgi:peroxiredoxin
VENFLLVALIILWIVVLLNIILTLALVRRVNSLSQSTPGVSPAVGGLPLGAKAPDFTASTLEGETVTLARYSERPTTFVFVAPHCQPCHELIPSLQRLAQAAHKAGAELVLVSDGSLAETQEMAHELHIEIIPLLVAPRDQNSFLQSYNISMTPTFCSLDEYGEVQSVGHPNQSNLAWQKLTEQWSKQEAQKGVEKTRVGL